MLLVGIDEAGYGPLLGPLVVGATAWCMADGREGDDLWRLLDDCVTRSAERGDWRIAIDDSKTLFDRKAGVRTLERGVLAAARAAGLPAATLDDFLGAIGVERTPHTSTAMPWYRDLPRTLPVDAASAVSEALVTRLQQALAAADVGVVRLRCGLVAEDRFNARVARTRNKAAVLAEQVLRMIDWAGRLAGGQRLVVRVDRLGARCNYRKLLAEAFAARAMHVLEESESRSAYRMRDGGSEWLVEFLVDADRTQLPVALASMLAKYVREIVMARFNAFWRRWLPEIRPTAGYYQDAQRFLADIAPAIPRAGVPTGQFVRAR
jgi:hypothetical protein